MIKSDNPQGGTPVCQFLVSIPVDSREYVLSVWEKLRQALQDVPRYKLDMTMTEVRSIDNGVGIRDNQRPSRSNSDSS